MTVAPPHAQPKKRAAAGTPPGRRSRAAPGVKTPAGPLGDGGPPGHASSAAAPGPGTPAGPPMGAQPAAELGAVIGWRVRSRAREIGLSSSDLARRVGLSKGMISKIENAQVSPSLATMARLARALDIPVTSLFQGLDEECDALFTKNGAGPELSRPGTRTGHRYQLLGSMRGPAKRMEPMVVTLTSEREVFPLYQHPGTELLYMLEGVMDYGYGGASYHMTAGDALQFDGQVAHGPVGLDALPVRFLSVTAYGQPPLGDKESVAHRRPRAGSTS